MISRKFTGHGNYIICKKQILKIKISHITNPSTYNGLARVYREVQWKFYNKIRKFSEVDRVFSFLFFRINKNISYKVGFGQISIKIWQISVNELRSQWVAVSILVPSYKVQYQEQKPGHINLFVLLILIICDSHLNSIHESFKLLYF